MIIFFILFSSDVFSGAIEDACGGDELRLDSPGGSMHNLPVLDQSTGGAGSESGGLCYSYVASQMIDAYLQKNNNREEGRISSPFHIAFNHAHLRNRRKLKGGDPCLAIKATVKSKGTCHHDQWFFGERDLRNNHFLFTLEDIWNQRQFSYDFQQYGTDEYARDLRSQSQIEKDAEAGACRMARFDIFSSPDLEIYEQAKKVLLRLLGDEKYFNANEDDVEKRAKKFIEFGRDFSNMLCRPAESPIRPKIHPETPATARCKSENYGPSENEKLQIDILNKLSHTGLPVSVGFCSFYLLDERRKQQPGNHTVLSWENNQTPKCDSPTGYEIENGQAVLKTEPKKSYHISMVMGKRMRGGRCQVLLRNTWGADSCESYKVAGHSDCAGGQVWLDLEEFSKNSFAVRSIE